MDVTTTIAFYSQLQVDRCRFTCCFSEHKKKPTSCFRETFRLSLFPDWLMFDLNKHGPVSVLKSTKRALNDSPVTTRLFFQGFYFDKRRRGRSDWTAESFLL